MPSERTWPSSLVPSVSVTLRRATVRGAARETGCEGSQVVDQVIHLGGREVEGGHAIAGAAGAEESCEVLIVARVQLGHDVGAGLASGSVAAVAAGAAGFVGAAARVGRLGGGEDG